MFPLSGFSLSIVFTVADQSGSSDMIFQCGLFWIYSRQTHKQTVIKKNGSRSLSARSLSARAHGEEESVNHKIHRPSVVFRLLFPSQQVFLFVLLSWGGQHTEKCH